MNGKSIRVAVVEDQPGFRQALEVLLSHTPGFECAGVFPQVDAVLAFLKTADSARPDIVLLDIELPPGLSGIEGARRIRALPDPPLVLMLTAFGDPERVFNSLESGAVGYLLKRMPPAEILDALKDAMDGGAPMSGTIARMVVKSFDRRGPSAMPNRVGVLAVRATKTMRDLQETKSEVEKLAPRETELLRHLSDGLRYKEIADQMGITINTVRCYIRRIYEKLHATSKLEALRKVGEI